jgi:hypothetical protein
MEENMFYAMSRLVTAAVIGVLVTEFSVSARANVITVWDEKAIAVTTPLANFGVGTTPYMAQRMMAMVHAAMFDAVSRRSSSLHGSRWFCRQLHKVRSVATLDRIVTEREATWQPIAFVTATLTTIRNKRRL